MGDYVVTECGFGSDLGFEKYADLVAGVTGYDIHSVVIVATVRALRHQGGGEGMKSLETGLANLGKHIDNVASFGFSPIVAVNVFPDDRSEELELIRKYCEDRGVTAELSEVFLKGGEGALDLARRVVDEADSSDGSFQPVYDRDDPPAEKIEKVAKHIYGADGVIYSWEAKKQLKVIRRLGLEHFPICIAKTPLSLSDNKKKLNVPTGWRLNINDIKIAHGGGYLIPISGDIMLMPGLPKVPSAEGIDVDSSGRHITGLS
jgi:formate--tetrahydrofolate ligase